MNENKNLQVIYNYLTNDVSDEEIRELAIYLREYVLNGSWVEYETTEEDIERLMIDMKIFIK
jgi:hypothetical protein